MLMRKVFVGVAFAGAVLNTAPAKAQAPLFDVAALQGSCAASGDACLAAIRAAMASLQALGLQPAALNTQLGVVAGIATESASVAPPSDQAVYAAALNEIADVSSDPGQVASLVELAGQFEAGIGANVEAVADAGSDN